MGDSITDGDQSTSNTNRRWPDFLARRLLANGQQVGIMNEGIAGGRILADVAGPSGLARFDRDVLTIGNATFLATLHGINDIANGSTDAQVIAGLRQYIARARAQGLKVFGCTLTPAGYGAGSQNENRRNAVNAFIRAPGNYDGVFDFDLATRNPQNPAALLPLYDSGDGLHPSDAGYEAMANVIDLALLQ